MRVSYLHRRWLGLTPDDRLIAIGAFVVAVLIVVAKGVAALKEGAMAWRYGTGGVVDAYQLAFTAVTWIPTTLVSVCSIMLVPFLAGLQAQGFQAERQFLSEINGAALLLGVALSVLCVCAAGPLMVAIGSDLAPDTQQMAGSLATLMSPLAAISLINGVLATRLQATGRHVNVLLEGLPPLVLFGFLLCSLTTQTEIAPLVLGTISGAVIHTAFLVWFVSREKGGLGGLTVGFRSALWAKLYRAAAVMLVGVVAMGFTVPIDLIYVAQVGDGAIASFNYANRMLALLSALGALAISRSTLPIFSAAVARDGSGSVRKDAIRWALVSGFCGAVVALLAWGAAPFLVLGLFEHGAFTQQDAIEVVTVFRVGLLQLPFFFASIVLVQYLAAAKRYLTISAAGLVALLTKLSLIPWLTASLATDGVMLSSMGMHMATLGWLAYGLARQHQQRVNAG